MLPHKYFKSELNHKLSDDYNCAQTCVNVRLSLNYRKKYRNPGEKSGVSKFEDKSAFSSELFTIKWQDEYFEDFKIASIFKECAKG